MRPASGQAGTPRAGGGQDRKEDGATGAGTGRSSLPVPCWPREGGGMDLPLV